MDSTHLDHYLDFDEILFICTLDIAVFLLLAIIVYVVGALNLYFFVGVLVDTDILGDTMCEVKATSSQRRGGSSQYLASLYRDRSRSPQRDTVVSELGTEMLKDFALGNVKCPSIGRLARAGCRDGLGENIALAKLAHLGSSGACERNMRRDLRNTFLGGEINDVLCHLDGDSDVKTFLYPHTIFQRLGARKGELQKRLGAKRSWLRDWWAQFRMRPQGRIMFEIHDDLVGKTLDELETLIPLPKYAVNVTWFFDGGWLDGRLAQSYVEWVRI